MRSDVGPFGMVPLWLLRRGVSSPAIHLYALLAAAYADREGKAWPSRATLAEQMGCSVDTVDRAVRELVDAQAMFKGRRANERGGQASNVYVLRFAAPGEVEESESPVVGAAKTGRGGPQKQGGGGPQKPDTNHTHIEPDPALRAGATTTADKPTKPKPIPGDVFRLYDERWRPRYPNETHAYTGQHGKQAKELLATLTLADLARRMDLFFASDRPYYAEHRHTFDLFARDVNRFIPTAAAPPGTTPDDEDDMDPETRAIMQELRARNRRKPDGGHPHGH